MANDPMEVDMCTCATCGYAWVRGRDGSHSCAEHLLKTVAEQKLTIETLEKARMLAIDLHPGSLVVLECEHSLPFFQVEVLRQSFRDLFGESVRALVLEGGVHFAALLRPIGVDLGVHMDAQAVARAVGLMTKDDLTKGEES
jgi:hypothetical protein